MTTRNLAKCSAVAALLLLGIARAELPNLPRPVSLGRTGDSPGQVTFAHDSHVDAAKPSCVTCHPRRFGILGRSAERKDAPITHARMEKGDACGACHGNGKKAFGFDDCSACHAQ